MEKFLLGSSYYPEWWSSEEWDEDFAKMEALGFNAVRMGEFAWSWFEPEEGKYIFEPMLKVLDIAQKHGISVIMGTVTAVCPAWLYRKYPEVKGGNTSGDYNFGGRKGQCLSSKVFLEYAEKITEAQVKALGLHPAIVGWQLDNEPGFPFWDFDENCKLGFREWLRNKYGTIEKLNDAWFTMMWSNVYTSFDEIDIPINACEGGWTPEIQLDYRKYFSFTFNRLLKMEAEIVRRYSPKRFIYTNWPGANWSVNCFEATEYLDYAGWDNYVGQPNGDNYRIQLCASMEHSFDRRLSCGKNRFIVAEQHGYTDANTPSDVIRAQTWLNVSHGAFATVFFEWRTPRGGAEQEYDSILARDKNYRRETYSVLKKLSGELAKYGRLLINGKTVSSIAAVYSYENSWGTPGWRVDGFYDEEFFNAYGGFKNQLKTNVDVVGLQDDFSAYKLLIMPNCRIVSDDAVKKLYAFVENGGILVMNTECGIRDEFNRMLEMLKPGVFSELCGAVSESWIDADRLVSQTGVKPTVLLGGKAVGVSSRINVINTKTADVIGVYNDGLLKGTPAVTVGKYGKGSVVLYGTDGNDVYFYEALAGVIAERFGFESLISAEDGIIVSSRLCEDRKYIIAVNMKDKPCKYHIDGSATELLTGEKVSGDVILDGYDVALLTDFDN